MSQAPEDWVVGAGVAGCFQQRGQRGEAQAEGLTRGWSVGWGRGQSGRVSSRVLGALLALPWERGGAGCECAAPCRGFL